MKQLEAYHRLSHGRCLRCKQRARCEKAHIIEREFGGLDVVCNMVPLCYPCHAEQPVFRPGEEWRAWAWFSTSSEMDYLVHMMWRCFLESGPELRARMIDPDTRNDAVAEARVSLGLDAPAAA